jgi:hypothetical protein
MLLEPATFIHLYVVYGCFLITLVEFSRCNWDGIVHNPENIFYFTLYREFDDHYDIDYGGFFE